ncbi:hypothetical protein BBJ28_00000343 [Nothophytophthora sp. Chile5]|nr:hypothetical protein BBJ28_00000343 [Nothophytophthora sp. Chile5]
MPRMAEELKTRRGNARRPRGARSALKTGEAVSLASYIQASLDGKLASERAVTRHGRGRNRRSKTKAQQQEQAEGDVGDATALDRTVVVANMVDTEKLQDPEEFQDVETDLRATFERFGVLESLHLCQTTAEVTLVFVSAVEAKAAVQTTNGKHFGGRPVTARLQSELVEDKSSVNAARMGSVDPPPLVRDEKKQVEREIVKKRTRKRRSKAKNAIVKSREALHLEGANAKAEIATESRTFCVRNLVEAGELQDDDEYEEIRGELTADFSRFGDLVEVVVARYQDSEKGGRQGVLVGDVVVTYQEEACAVAAFLAFNGKTFGGRMVTCFWGHNEVTRDATVVIEGMLTPKELEDPDEFVDVQEETLQLCSKHGQVTDLKLCENTGSVTVTFNDSRDANELVRTLNGSQYGGRLLTPTESSEMQYLVGAFLKRLAALQVFGTQQQSWKGHRRS